MLESRQVLSKLPLTVTSIADGGLPGDGTLRGEIAAAQSGDTIDFATALDGQTITLTGGQLLINKSLTIQGPGAAQLAVSGGGVSRVFQVAQGTNPVTVSGLTICNGAPAGTGSYGGAIDNFGTLTVSGCTFTGNSAYYGGAIENETGGTLTVNGCTLAWSLAGNWGGYTSNAIYGGAIENETGSALTVTGCTISGNGAEQAGGGIFNAGTASIVNTTVSGNGAAQGGGIYNNGGGTLSISGCAITSNRAAEGGGIETNGTTSIVNTTVSNNVAYAGDNNGDGGGISDGWSGSLTLQGCTFAGNGAGGYGGAIADYSASGFTITGCTFTGNYDTPRRCRQLSEGLSCHSFLPRRLRR
jgi:hypothetical protein